MAANPISKYYKNNTVKENDPYGFGRFAKGNVQRGQQLLTADTDITSRKSADVSPGTDTFSLRPNKPGPSVQIVKKGIDVYKQNNRSFNGNIDRKISTNSLNKQTGPSTFRTSFSIFGKSNNSAQPNAFALKSKTNANRAADIYRNTAFSSKRNSGPMSKGSGFLSGSANKPLSGGLMSGSKISSPVNRNSGNTTIKQGITQYKSFDSKKQSRKNELFEDTESLFESGVEELKEQETL